MPEPEVKLVLLCDDIRQEVGGKVSFIGVFDHFRVADLTQPLPPFRLFVKIAFREEGEYPLALNIRSEQGDFNAEVQGLVRVRTQDEVSGQYVAFINVRFIDLKIPHPGTYYIDLICQDREIYSLPFRAVTAPSPTLQ